MKLDFESNTSTFAPVAGDYSVPAETDNSAEVAEMLRKGIEAAQNGEPSEARSLLLSVTEIDPNNEKAWLWLASISEYPEELLVFLNSVLRINPGNERAAEWAKATRTLLSKTFVQRGIDASGDQDDFAKQCFLQAIVHDNKSEMAWLWLASLATSDDEKSSYLQKVLEINSNNLTAQSLLKSINQKSGEALFQKAVEFAANDENSEALGALQEYFLQSPKAENAWLLKSFLVGSLDEKSECYKNVLEINPENDLARMSADFLRSILGKDETISASEENQSDEQAVEEDLVQNLETSEYFSQSAADSETEFVETAEENYEIAAETSDEIETKEAEFAFYEEKQESDDFAQTDIFYADEPEDEDYVYSEYESKSGGYENVQELTQVYAFQENAEISEQIDESESNKLEDAEVFVETNSENDSTGIYEIELGTAAAESDYSDSSEPSENYFEVAPVFSEATALSFDENNLPPEEESVDLEIPPADYLDQENDFQTAVALPVCSFCDAENEPQSFVCRLCRAVLTLSNLEMVLGNQAADKEMIGNAVGMWEAEKNVREMQPDEMKQLALGYLNLGNTAKGLNYLSEAARMNPDDIVLSSQLTALKIRLAEIEKQRDIHGSMPKNLTILVVDDSATVRKLISGKLEKSGHEVVCAMDGVDALEKIKEIVPDLILLDINMPRMDGYQVCKMIRGNEATKDVPVVMISGKDGFFDKVRGRMAGTTGYITKPFGPETLMKTVETYIV